MTLLATTACTLGSAASFATCDLGMVAAIALIVLNPWTLRACASCSLDIMGPCALAIAEARVERASCDAGTAEI
jgi:hypothetical protein